ncbi:glycosyltransferase family 4 protein [Nocardioides deserti]|uniref:Glycosyltransferase family 4 protein n=1 Tax=Nocardioides deserti TaxID=1588644 RepID=A0ABR6U8C6_9ACTN|nr:glycosyltransferase family 4 protein [Nocardioides deserti]MBC2960635.1 glycosyltransferase family 4 protein [Nocardioides deserti]GGO78750.1 glycosyl transferase [Nocardioides deserti]
MTRDGTRQMTRVVQVLTQASGGPVDHAVDVAAELARRGVDSHVVGPRPVHAPGVTWHGTTVAGKADVRGARDTLALLRSLRPDVVHAHDRRAGWLARLAAPVLGAPVVYTLHGVADGLSDLVAGNVRAAERRRRDRLYYLTGERLVTRWARARVVVPSAAVATYAVARVGLPESAVSVVHNGVDPARWRPAAAPDGPVTVVWSGVLGGVKRVGLLLDALAAVPAARALVVGDGPERPLAERRAAEPALAGRVELTGWLSDPAPAYARGHLLALTSAAENLPLSVLQAMSCGLPVVATAVGGVPEVVRDGVEGLLVPADDPAALTAALRRMVEDDGLRERAGKAARDRVEESFSLAGCVDGLQRVYDEVRS